MKIFMFNSVSIISYYMRSEFIVQISIYINKIYQSFLKFLTQFVINIILFISLFLNNKNFSQGFRLLHIFFWNIYLKQISCIHFEVVIIYFFNLVFFYILKEKNFK